VLATQAWRLADLGAEHSMLLSGLGWGNMRPPAGSPIISRAPLEMRHEEQILTSR